MLCGFSSLWWPFGWNLSYLAFLGIIWRTCGSKCQGEGGGIFLTLCVECCLVSSLNTNHLVFKPKSLSQRVYFFQLIFEHHVVKKFICFRIILIIALGLHSQSCLHYTLRGINYTFGGWITQYTPRVVDYTFRYSQTAHFIFIEFGILVRKLVTKQRMVTNF